MSYRKELGIISQQQFAEIGHKITDTLDGFEPTEHYAVRDVLLADNGAPQVVEREEHTPLTPDVQYREIRDRRLLEGVNVEEYPTPRSLGMSCWFNVKMAIAYGIEVGGVRLNTFRLEPPGAELASVVNCTRRPPGKEFPHLWPEDCLDILEENLDFGEFSFFVPREATKKEIKNFEPGYWDDLLSYGYYRMYRSPNDIISTSGLTFTTPNFALIYKLRHEQLTKAATAYLFDPEIYLAENGIDPDDPTPAQEAFCDELQGILRVKDTVSAKIESEISIGEAVKLYGEQQTLWLSREMQSVSDIAVQVPSTWPRAYQLLNNYIEQISLKR